MASGRFRDSGQIDSRRRRRDGRKANKGKGTTNANVDLETNEQQRTMAAALKLLAARPRSEIQLRQRLDEKEIASPGAIEQCIARLKELGLIDDRRFAENYARSRLAAKAVGRSRLAAQLAAKRVNRNAIADALDQIFKESREEELIDRAIRRHTKLRGVPGDRVGARKLFQHLARLGFEFDLIRRKLRALGKEVEEQ